MTTYAQVMDRISKDAISNMNFYWRASVNVREVAAILNELNENKFAFAMSGILADTDYYDDNGNYKFRQFVNIKLLGSFHGLKDMYSDDVNTVGVVGKFWGEKCERLAGKMYRMTVDFADLLAYGTTEEMIRALYDLHRQIDKVIDEMNSFAAGKHADQIKSMYKVALKKLHVIEDALIEVLDDSYSVIDDVNRQYAVKHFGNGYMSIYVGGINNCYPQKH